MNTGHKIIWKAPWFREPRTRYERDFGKAKEVADQFAKELLVAEVFEYHAADASDAKRVYVAIPDPLHLEWSRNGQRVVVVENGTERFVKIGGEVIKLVVAPKPPTKKQKDAAFLRMLDRKVLFANPPRVTKAEQEEMWREMARGIKCT